ncbi:hypothetical protein Avbf_01728 [Armadillidium vulgare]|nr:hypothetical protein Avbf_01728 [Armadillidium vulgare]
MFKREEEEEEKKKKKKKRRRRKSIFLPFLWQTFERDENKGRTASKVSKIATMFQCPSENEEKDERDGPGSATVVRTESHVARFNTARALFEKMAEKKEESKANKGFNQRRQFSSLQSSRSIPSCGKAHSRSPSPPVPHPSHQSNGHHCSSCKANLSSVSTIASISYTSTTPTFHSSAQNPSVPSVLPFKARSSSFDSEALKGKWHNTIPGAETSKSNYSEQLRCKNEFAKTQNDERLVKPQEICCSDNRVYHTSTLPAKIEDANRDFNRKYEQSLVKAMENKSKPSLLSKPEKPAKPETLIDKPLSSHLQNQQIIQRHKNWFQSFSKIKSPVTSPQKHHQQSSNSQPACNVLEQRRHSEDPAAIHNDWRRERSAILRGPGKVKHS